MKKYIDQMVEQIGKAPDHAGGHEDKPQVGALKCNLFLVQIEKYNNTKNRTCYICNYR